MLPVTAFIVACTYIPNLLGGLGMRYVPNLLLFINGTGYRYSKCQTQNFNHKNLISLLLNFAISVWIPMVLIVITYILIYLKFKQTGRTEEKSLLTRSKCTDEKDIKNLH